ncbi:unnamed protein product [Caenorhabditis sp. 36 PRJEB53466]|nr:unnamed protein product [Caenorhabditis sp. 36 PRJEB53466]
MEMETTQRTILEMKKENVREMAQVIKTILFKEQGTIHAFDKGIKITVDDAACQQANLFIDATFFSNFHVREENIAVKWPIKHIFEFLNIPEGSSNSCKFSYNGMFAPLNLLIEDSEGYVMRGRLNSTMAEQELDFEFQDATVLATFMLKTQVLKDVFKDFDETSRLVKIEFMKTQICFSTDGEVGDITVSIPSKSLQMETVKCVEEVEFSYKLTLLQRMVIALGMAAKVVMRVDDRGVLCCHFTIDHGDNRQSYVEFLTVPDIDDNESDV